MIVFGTAVGSLVASVSALVYVTVTTKKTQELLAQTSALNTETHHKQCSTYRSLHQMYELGLAPNSREHLRQMRANLISQDERLGVSEAQQLPQV